MFESELSVLLFGKKDPMRPLVFQVIQRRPSESKGPHPSHPIVRWNICGVREDPVSSEIGQKLKGHVVVGRRWEPQEEASVQKNRMGQKGY